MILLNGSGYFKDMFTTRSDNASCLFTLSSVRCIADMQAQNKSPRFTKHRTLNIMKDLDINRCLDLLKYCKADLFEKVTEQMKTGGCICCPTCVWLQLNWDIRRSLPAAAASAYAVLPAWAFRVRHHGKMLYLHITLCMRGQILLAW